MSKKTGQALEASEIAHYDAHAAHKLRRDLLPSSRIPRRDIVRRCIRYVAEQRGGSLGTVVDVGCGAGVGAVYLEGLFERYVGVDFSQGMIEVGREFTKNIPNVELVVGNIKGSDIDADLADVVYMDGALHHMDDLDDVMSSLRRIAKPGAWFVAREPQRGNPFIQMLRWLRMRVDKSYSPDQRFFLKREVIELLEKHGFTDIKVKYQGFLTPPMAQVVIPPQFLSGPFASLLTMLEGPVEAIMVGPLGRLSWNLSAYGRFPEANDDG